MKTLLTYSRQLLLALGLAAVQSCAHRPVELPVPVPTTASSLSVSEAQAWYQDTYPGAAIATGSSQPSSVTATAGGTSTSAELVWSRALTVGKGAQQLVLVPLAGDEALFAHTKYVGPRYLIVAKTANNVLEGNVLELLLPRATASLDTLGLFTSLYRSYHSGHLVAPSVGEGFLFLYSPDYAYLTGRHFQQGQFQPQAIRLAFALRGTTQSAKAANYPGLEVSTTNNAPPIGNTCYDWYQESGGKYVYITSTGDCSYGGDGGANVPYPYTGGGGPAGGGGYTGPSGHGGGGGGYTAGDTAELRQFEQDYRSQMSQSELAIFDSLTRAQQVAYLINAKDARNKATAKFASFDLHNGPGDAFRHAYFVAKNTRNIYLGPDLTKRLYDAHEQDPNQPAIEHEMDSFNNYAGLLIAGLLIGLDTSSSDIEATVYNWLLTGRLKIIENGQVVSSH